MINLEPEVQELAKLIDAHIKDCGPVSDGEFTSPAFLSIAISLKRIADLLDGTTMNINVTETIFNPNTIRRVTNNY